MHCLWSVPHLPWHSPHLPGCLPHIPPPDIDGGCVTRLYIDHGISGADGSFVPDGCARHLEGEARVTMVTEKRYIDLFYTRPQDGSGARRVTDAPDARAGSEEVNPKVRLEPGDDALAELRKIMEDVETQKVKQARQTLKIITRKAVADFSWHMSMLAKRRHYMTDGINAKIRARWDELKGDRGMSKGKAAGIIAPEVGQTVGTVRKKLQKM